MKAYLRRIITTLTLTSALASSGRSSGSCDNSNNEALAQKLDQIVYDYKLPGIVAATWHHGEIVRIASAGVRKVGFNAVPMESTDKMHLGSCTKAMTSTLLAMLMEDKTNLLTMNSTLGQIFDDWILHPQIQQISIRQLMLHRSGLDANPSSRVYNETKSNMENREILLQDLFQTAPVNNPNDWIYLYSNIGYIILGAVAEKVTGQSWEDLMQNRLFGPLGITSAGFGPPADNAILPPLQPWGHIRTLWGRLLLPRNVDNPAIYGPAGTVHMSLEDWAKFASLHLMENNTNTAQLLSKESLDALHDPNSPGPLPHSYAAGWGVLEREWADGIALQHSGSNTLWFSTIWLAPKRELAFLVASNVFDAKAVDAAVVAMLGLLENNTELY